LSLRRRPCVQARASRRGAVADCDLYWIEEPFQESRDGLKRLREAMAQAGYKIRDGERIMPDVPGFGLKPTGR